MNIDKVLISSGSSQGEKSVSLTLLLVAGVAVLVAAGLEMAGLVKNTSILMEFFAINASLYFGRRFTNSKTGGAVEGDK